MRKSFFALTGTILLILLLAGAFLGTNLVKADTDIQTTQDEEMEISRTVSVSGIGEVQSAPDVAIIRMGVQTEADTASMALDENNEAMQSLIDSLEEAGIESENIQTQTLNLFPRYQQDNETNQRTLVGYTATNTVSVRTDDLDTIGTLLDEAVAAGANTIDSIRFEISDPQDLADQAREAAVMEAQRKAEQLAELTGTTLGPVISINESSSIPGPVVREEAFAQTAAAVPIEPGSQSITVQVQITWSLVIEE